MKSVAGEHYRAGEILWPIWVEASRLGEGDGCPLDRDESREWVDGLLDKHGTEAAHLLGECRVKRTEGPKRDRWLGDSDRAMAILECGIGLRPCLRGLPKLQGG